MASVPYAAPYAPQIANARQPLSLDTRLLRIALLFLGGLLAISLLQLVLSGETTDAIMSIYDLEKDVAVLQAEVDALTAQAEGLGAPRRIEAEATRLGFRPFTIVEFVR